MDWRGSGPFKLVTIKLLRLVNLKHSTVGMFDNMLSGRQFLHPNKQSVAHFVIRAAKGTASIHISRHTHVMQSCASCNTGKPYSLCLFIDSLLFSVIKINILIISLKCFFFKAKISFKKNILENDSNESLQNYFPLFQKKKLIMNILK
jgi:hypothetical protein